MRYHRWKHKKDPTKANPKPRSGTERMKPRKDRHCPSCGSWNKNPWWTQAYRSKAGSWLVRPGDRRLGSPSVRIRRRTRLCENPWHQEL